MSSFRFKVATAATVFGLVACTEKNAGITALDASNVNDVVPSSASWFPFVQANDAPPEFWDNVSLDGIHCNVGFYANGPFDNAPVGPCLTPIAGSPANATTFQATEFYGQNLGAAPAPFMFEAGTYEVVFLDGFRANGLQPVGYFTKSGTTYDFTPISPAVSSIV